MQHELRLRLFGSSWSKARVHQLEAVRAGPGMNRVGDAQRRQSPRVRLAVADFERVAETAEIDEAGWLAGR